MKKLIVSVLLVISFTACKKDKDKSCTQDMAGISGSHKITAISYKASSSSSAQDYYNAIYTDPCEKDDIVTFKSDGTYNFTDAGVKCDPVGDDSGNWSQTGNTLTFDGQALNIKSFDCNKLVLSSTGYNTPGDEIDYTFTRQ